MATQWGDNLKITGLIAGADLSAKQFFPVKFASTVGAVVVASAVSDKVVGILNNAPASGEPAEIIGLGNAKARLAASIAVGTYLTPNSTGHLKAAASANDRIVGMLLEASVGAGDIRPIFVAPSNL